MSRLTGHALWLVGFRPFFALACLSGLILPALWVLIYTGVLAAPADGFTIFQWHAHEMFFGFGWAMLGGFLLTATKNWVGSRGYHGASLAFLTAAWLFERVGMWFGAAWPPLLFRLSNNLFLVAIVAMVMATLIRHRATDSYRGDNFFFLLILPLFPVAKYLMLLPDSFQLGSGMAIGLFRIAFLVMLERTLGTFMKGVFQAALLRNTALDMSIKFLAVVLVGAGLMPGYAAAAVELLLAALLLGRFAFWQPQLGMRRLDIGIMYLGYLAIVAQLQLDAVNQLASVAWVGSVSIHAFTFGAMGLIMPAMVIRISKGHTGRKVVFDGGDKAVLWLMLAALALRVVAPQFHPGGYTLWIVLAAACWCVSFGVLAWRYIPFLVQPRADGKEH